jgi:sensor histidine kinase regulating citrate/malate metabolism
VTDSQLFVVWGWSLVAAAVVVVLAAVLLIAILLVARRILAHARQALAAAEAIAEDTNVIWKLDDTNRVAGEILEASESIEERGGRVAGTLQGDRAASGGGTA